MLHVLLDFTFLRDYGFFLFNVCIDKDFAHHSVLASRGVPFSRGDFGSFAYLVTLGTLRSETRRLL